MSKRGQITIFVIIAIVIVVAIAAFFLIKSQTSSFNKSIPSDIQPVYHYVDTCFKNSFEESLFLVGLQGGYTASPQNSLQTNLTNVGFAFTDNQIVLLPKQYVEKKMNDYISLNVKKCLDDTALDSSYEITYSTISPSVKI
jgi:hypothetical protein